MILALARDAEVSDAYVREGLGCLNRLRAVCGPFLRLSFDLCAATASRPTPSTSGRSRAAGRHEAEFDEFLLGALAESKVDNPVLRPASRTPSTPSPVVLRAGLGGRARARSRSPGAPRRPTTPRRGRRPGHAVPQGRRRRRTTTD